MELAPAKREQFLQNTCGDDVELCLDVCFGERNERQFDKLGNRNE